MSGVDALTVCNAAAMSNKLRVENEKRKNAQLQTENEELKAALLLSVEEKCAKYHIQDCVCCLNVECADNLNPLKDAIVAQKAQAFDKTAEL